ncbi:MAG: hypothetical protein WCC66_00800 [Rhizobiaceae bacterium]
MGYALLIAVAIVIAAFAFKTRSVNPHTVAESEIPAFLPQGALGKFAGVLNSVNSESDPDFLSALKDLRKDKKTVLAEAARCLAEPAEGNFALRHSVVLAIAAMRDPAALDLLSEVALNPQPLPPKERPGGGEVALNPQPLPPVDGPIEAHGAEDIVQGAMVALDAIDGIEMLADDGNAKALDVLVKATQVNSNAIRGAALTALGARGDRWEHLQRAMASLPFELNALAGLRRVNVRDVPQIRDPRMHLIGDGNLATPAPALRGDKGYQTRTPVPGAPQIRKG